MIDYLMFEYLCGEDKENVIRETGAEYLEDERDLWFEIGDETLTKLPQMVSPAVVRIAYVVGGRTYTDNVPCWLGVKDGRVVAYIETDYVT